MPGKNDKDIFTTFTFRAGHVMRLAQEEAQRLNHNYIGTEHMLLGLLSEGEGIGAKVLERMGVRLEDARRAVEFIIGRGDHVVLGEIGMTPRAKKVVELSLDEARRLGHKFIGTEHLLLGLIREGHGIAAGVLERLGVDLREARHEVLHTLNGERQLRNVAASTLDPEMAAAAAVSGTKANVLTCRIDDRDLDALDALVEAGIRSTRSDAASWLIHAGIDAQHDLFERVYTTVAQIRQLRAEAQRLAQGIMTSGTSAADKDATDATESLAPDEGEEQLTS